MSRKILLSIAFLLVLNSSGFAEVKVGPNVNVVANEPIPQKQLEVDAQASPARPEFLFTGYINYQTGTEFEGERVTARARCGFSYSTNGGKTWKNKAKAANPADDPNGNLAMGLLPTAAPEATVLKCGDPAITIDNLGNIYYFFLTELVGSEITLMSVATLTDPNDGSGELIYKGQVEIERGTGSPGQVLDKGYIIWVPDPSSTDPAAPGAVYACYANFDGSQAQNRKVVCSVSTDKDHKTWSKPNQTKLNGTIKSSNGVAAAPGPNGSIYLVFYAEVPTERNYYLVRVLPNGNAAGQPIPLLTTQFYPYEAPTRRDLARFPPFPTIVSDGNQWVGVFFSGYAGYLSGGGFGVTQPGPDSSPHIFGTYNSNGGASGSWTPPVVIDPGPLNRENVSHQFGPRATFAGGIVSVFYFDGRNTSKFLHDPSGDCWVQEPAPADCGRPLDLVSQGYLPTGRDRRFDARVIQGPVVGGNVLFTSSSTQVTIYDVDHNTQKIRQRNIDPACIATDPETVCVGVNLFNLPVTSVGGCVNAIGPDNVERQYCGSAFGGDYFAHATKEQWLRNPPGFSLPAWRYTRPGDSTTTLAWWTDYRRVALPLTGNVPDLYGNWTLFVNAGQENCVNPMSKNTDVLFAEITQDGLSASVKSTALREGTPPSFAVTVWNRTGRVDLMGDPIPTFVRLTIEDTSSEDWSFEQTLPSPDPIPADQNSVDAKILNAGSVTLGVFYRWRTPGVISPPVTPVRIRVEEIDDLDGSLVPGGLTTSATYNPFVLPNDGSLPYTLTLSGRFKHSTTPFTLTSQPSHSVPFDDLGFDDLGFDDLGFDDLGFDDLGFDDLGFDDLGFDDLGFDDLGFSGLPEEQIMFTVSGGGSLSTVGQTFLNVSNGEELLRNNWKFWLGIVQTQWNTSVSGCQLVGTPTDIVISSIPITQPNTSPTDQNFQVSFDDLGFDDLGFDDLGFSSVPEQFQDATFSLNKGERAKIVLKAFKPEEGPGSELVFTPSDDTIGQAALGPNDPTTGDPVAAFFDTTPPVITPVIVGTLGGNGWYRSDVTVSWIVKDAQSGISSKSGCDPITLTDDTAGTLLTCTALNNAPDPDDRESSVSVTIKIDTVPPNTTITAGPADGSSFSATTTSFSFSGEDSAPASGIALFECKLDSAEFSACVTPITLTGLTVGPHTFSVRATDVAGNVEDTPATRTFTVTYQFVGFFSPLGAPDTYWGSNQLGNAQPIKYQLLFGGVPVNDLGTLLSLDAYFTGPPTSGSCPVTTPGTAINVYSPASGFKGASSLKSGSNQFTFSMDTKIFSPTPGKGCYTIVLRFSDGQVKKGSLQLK